MDRAEKQSRKGRVQTAVRVLVSTTLIGYLLWQADPAKILTEWQRIVIPWLLLAVLLQVVGVGISAWKWCMLLRAQGYAVPYNWAVRAYFMGQFFNNFLPTMIGGDAVRAYQLSQRIGQLTPAVASVFVERLTGFLALTVIAVTSLLLSYSLLADAPRLLLGTLLLGLAAGGVLLLALFAAPITRLLTRLRLPDVAGWRGKLESMAGQLSAYRQHSGTLARAVLLSFGYQLVWISSNYAAALALGISAPFSFFTLMVPMSDIVGLAPIFLNSLGAREGTFVVFLGQIGVQDTRALALAFLIFIVRLVVSLIGGLLYLGGGFGASKQLPQTVEP